MTDSYGFTVQHIDHSAKHGLATIAFHIEMPALWLVETWPRWCIAKISEGYGLLDAMQHLPANMLPAVAPQPTPAANTNTHLQNDLMRAYKFGASQRDGLCKKEVPAAVANLALPLGTMCVFGCRWGLDDLVRFLQMNRTDKHISAVVQRMQDLTELVFPERIQIMRSAIADYEELKNCKADLEKICKVITPEQLHAALTPVQPPNAGTTPNTEFSKT